MYDAAEPLSIEEVGGLLGGECANWPPSTRVALSKMRKAMKGSGWTISTNKGGHRNHGSYCLEFTGE